MSYYIPAIIIFIVAVLVIWFLFSLIRNIIREKQGKSTCMKCKAAASNTTRYPYLFLLPISFGETYSEPEKYLQQKMMPIMNRNQIPTGKRACKVEVFDCPRCNTRQVEITDFLLVRGDDCAKAYYTFSYDSFRPLLEAWENMNMNNQRNFNES